VGITKHDQFTSRQNRLATIAKALGHPARVAVIEHLVRVESCICGEIVSELPLAQATVSRHLRELKDAGIIQGTIEGNSICYCIAPDALADLNSFILNTLESPSCCRVLDCSPAYSDDKPQMNASEIS
jgi:ArsR family transcriptional regulator, arsenate/arsenite/antimonite-responsive transcriptional repressor